jgi:hypothetical protein
LSVFEIYSKVILQLSRSHQAFFRQFSGSNQAVIKQSSGSHQAVIRQSSDQSSDSHLAIFGQLSGSHQLVVRQSPASCQTGVRQAPPREETGSLQVANTSKYATQSLRSKSLHETQNPALADWSIIISKIILIQYQYLEKKQVFVFSISIYLKY